MATARLDDRAVIAVSGAEARTFLQGLITNDIEQIAPGQAIYAALLTPQGKVLFDFIVTEGDGALLIDCAAGSLDALMKRLTLYRLRANVTIEAREQLIVLASWNGSRIPAAITFEDPRLAALGHRAIGAKAEMPAQLDGPDTYHAHRVSLGVPEGQDFGSDRMFALDADLEELHGVSFDKGCYVGQELTARMKHRGTARKRLLPVVAADGGSLASDTPVTAGGRELGEIVAAHGPRGFALLRMDRLDEVSGVPVEATGLTVKIERPTWLFA